MSSESGVTAVSTAGMTRVDASVREETGGGQKPAQGKTVIEHQEEAKLKAKYPNLQMKSGGPTLLQKRLQRGLKYFDSGDYNMAKAKLNNPSASLPPSEKRYLQDSIGEAIPKPAKPENLPPKKPHCQTSKLVNETAAAAAAATATASSPSPL